MPQLTEPLQPSLAKPHSCPDGHAFGVQLMVPHLLAVGTPHCVPDGQVPHATRPPQPSGAKPQSWPAGQVVFGVQVVVGTHEPRSKIMYSSSFSCAVIGSRQTPPEQVLAQSAFFVHALPHGHRPPEQVPVQLASVEQVPLVFVGERLTLSAHWLGYFCVEFSDALSTWKSLNSTRPHCTAGGVVFRF